MSSARSQVVGIAVTPARRLAFFVVVDALLVTLGVAAAFLLRYDGVVAPEWLVSIPLASAVLAVGTIAALFALGVYRASWGFIGLRELSKVALAVIVGTALLAVVTQALFIQDHAWAFSRSVVLIQAPLTFCALAGFRLLKRTVRILREDESKGHGQPTLLIGAGQAGEQVMKSIIETDARHLFRVVGFLDDDRLAHGTRIHGKPVLGGLADLERHVKALYVKTVIICIAQASGPQVQGIVRRAKAAGAEHVRIIPPISAIVGGEVGIQTTREVSLEDLLGREKIDIDLADLRGLVSGKRVVVTGGAGTIGSELCRQVARLSPERLVILDVDESRLHDLAVDLRQLSDAPPIEEALIDVRDSAGLKDLFERQRFHLVFHAAAFKHVPMMEKWPVQALDVNVLGTANVAQAAEATGCERFVLISTDKAVDPSSIMGASKRLAEMALFGMPKPPGSRMTRSAVRFGNVIGSRGSVIPTFERQLQNGGPLTVTHPDMVRFFMMTSEAVSLVLQSASMGEGGDLFVLDMGEPVRILDVANQIIRLHGLEPGEDIQVVFTGLRPGEKLYEVLKYDHETLTGTKHPRVNRVDTGITSAPEDLLKTVRGLVDMRDSEAARTYFHTQFPSLRLHAQAAKADAAKAS